MVTKIPAGLSRILDSQTLPYWHVEYLTLKEELMLLKVINKSILLDKYNSLNELD